MKSLATIIILLSFLQGQAQNITSDSTETNSKDTVKMSIDIMPIYPGGEAAMMKFISKNVKYPSKARRKGIDGKVIVRFTVDKDGKIRDITTLNKKLGYGLEEAAMEVISKMPLWIPGTQNGVPVPVYFTIPIKFRLG